MKDAKFTEEELLEGLNDRTAHADELAQPLPQEVDPFERLHGSVKKYDRPFDGCGDGEIDSEE